MSLLSKHPRVQVPNIGGIWLQVPYACDGLGSGTLKPRLDLQHEHLSVLGTRSLGPHTLSKPLRELWLSSLFGPYENV